MSSVKQFFLWTVALIAAVVIVVIADPELIKKAPANNDAATGAAAHQLKKSTIVGITDGPLVNETAKEQASELASIKSTGITSLRLEANWAWVQPTGHNIFKWSSLDREVNSVRAAGMSFGFVIDGCPPWAAAPNAGHSQFAQPASSAQYASFAADVARRYASDGIDYFEIWNEPNNNEFWRPKPNPEAYTKDLIVAYAALKKTAPSIPVISGGLSPASDNGTNYAPATFLQIMYEDGAKGSFDAVADHPYSYPALPDTYAPWSSWSQMNQTNPSVRSVMVDNGDSNKQIWITEFGAPSSGPRGIGTAAQSKQLSEGLSYASSISWIGAIYFFTWQDSTNFHSSNGFGILAEDGSRKPAYYAISSALTDRHP